MNHKIVAIRMKSVNGGLIIEGLTQSPRGTKTIARQIKIALDTPGKEARRTALESGINALIHPSE